VRRPIVLAWVAFGLMLLVVNFYVSAIIQYMLPQEDFQDGFLPIMALPLIGIVVACAPALAMRRLWRSGIEEPRRWPLRRMAGIAAATIYLNWGVLLFAGDEFRQQLYPWSAVREAMSEERTRLLEARRALGIAPDAKLTDDQRVEMERRVGKDRYVRIPMTFVWVRFDHTVTDWSPRHVWFQWGDGRIATVDLNTRVILWADD
jgi:hypothetical protein